MSIAENIKNLRNTRGITQAELADKVGVTQSMINQIERGTKVPSLPLSKCIAIALRCDINDIAE